MNIIVSLPLLEVNFMEDIDSNNQANDTRFHILLHAYFTFLIFNEIPIFVLRSV